MRYKDGTGKVVTALALYCLLSGLPVLGQEYINTRHMNIREEWKALTATTRVHLAAGVGYMPGDIAEGVFHEETAHIDRLRLGLYFQGNADVFPRGNWGMGFKYSNLRSRLITTDEYDHETEDYLVIHYMGPAVLYRFLHHNDKRNLTGRISPGFYWAKNRGYNAGDWILESSRLSLSADVTYELQVSNKFNIGFVLYYSRVRMQEFILRGNIQPGGDFTDYVNYSHLGLAVALGF